MTSVPWGAPAAASSRARALVEPILTEQMVAEPPWEAPETKLPEPPPRRSWRDWLAQILPIGVVR